MTVDSGAQRSADMSVEAGNSDESGRWVAAGNRGHGKLGNELLFMAEYISPGVIGFALGGLLWSMIQVFYPGYAHDTYSGILFWIAGGFIFGFTGGFFLDILPKKRLEMALFSAAAYAIGLALMVFAVDLIMQGKQIPGGLIFALGILAVGFIFGLPLKRLKLFVLLGSCGFIAGGVLGMALYQVSIFLIQVTHVPLLNYLPGIAMFGGLGIGTGIMIGLGKYLVETK